MGRGTQWQGTSRVGMMVLVSKGRDAFFLKLSQEGG